MAVPFLGQRPRQNWRNNFEGGTAGKAVPDSPTNDGSGTPFDNIGATYDSSFPAHGNLCAHMTQGDYSWWKTATIGNRLCAYARCYLYWASDLTHPDCLIAFCNGGPGTELFEIKGPSGSGQLSAVDSGGTYIGNGTPGLLQPGVWYRLEAMCNVTTQTAEYRLYLADSEVPLEDKTFSNLAISGQSITSITGFGPDGAHSYMDDFAVSLQGWVGPGHSPGATVAASPTLTVTPGPTSNALSWTSPSDNGSWVYEYQIYRGTSSGGETLLATVTAPNLTYVDYGLTAGTTYYYKVAAVNGEGQGRASAEQTGVPQAGNPAPVQISNSVAASTNTVLAPSNLCAGNVLIAISCDPENDGVTMNLPSGFTVAGRWVSGADHGGSWVWGYRIATNSEPSRYVFSNSINNTVNVCSAILNYPANSLNPTPPIDGSAGASAQTNNSTSQAAQSTPSVSPSMSGEVLICAVSSHNGRSISSYPPEMAHGCQALLSSNEGMYVADEILTGTAATGSQTFTLTYADTGGGLSFLLKPNVSQTKTSPVQISNSSAAGTNTVNAPPNISAGNILIAISCDPNSDTAVMNLPSGFTIAGTWASDANHGATWAWGYKIASSSEPSTYTFSNSINASADVCNAILNYPANSLGRTGPVIDTASGTSAQSNNSTSQTGQVAPSVTPSTSGEVLVCAICSYYGRPISSYPTGMGDHVQALSEYNVGMFCADEILSGTTATGPQTFTLSYADVGGGISFLLHP